jgi:hypothetical protein
MSSFASSFSATTKPDLLRPTQLPLWAGRTRHPISPAPRATFSAPDRRFTSAPSRRLVRLSPRARRSRCGTRSLLLAGLPKQWRAGARLLRRAQAPQREVGRMVPRHCICRRRLSWLLSWQLCGCLDPQWPNLTCVISYLTLEHDVHGQINMHSKLQVHRGRRGDSSGSRRPKKSSDELREVDWHILLSLAYHLIAHHNPLQLNCRHSPRCVPCSQSSLYNKKDPTESVTARER